MAGWCNAVINIWSLQNMLEKKTVRVVRETKYKNKTADLQNQKQWKQVFRKVRKETSLRPELSG